MSAFLDKNQIKYKIKHLPYYLYLVLFDKRFKSGVLPKEPDDRDFKTSELGWSLFGYTPKNQRKVIEPFMVFNQGNLNCCVFCGTLSHKMDDEKVELDISDIISYAVRKGWVTGNGFTNIDTGMKVLYAYGCREGKNPVVLSDWDRISTKPFNATLASRHKIASYWDVNTRDDRLKLLDDGRTLNTAIPWFTGFNQGGGFKSPWIIDKDLGYEVGGHDIKIIGYDLNYNGKKVYICINSYGREWADDGKFYIEMDYFDKKTYGAITSLDIESKTGMFFNKYNGKNVKKKNGPAIWRIEGQQKHSYPNWETYLAYFGLADGHAVLSNEEADVLDLIENGTMMDIKVSPCNQLMSYISNADEREALLKALVQINYNKKLGVELTTNLE